MYVEERAKGGGGEGGDMRLYSLVAPVLYTSTICSCTHPLERPQDTDRP